MGTSKVSKYEYVECKFKGHCFMCHHRTNKVARNFVRPNYICSEECYEDYEKFVKKQLKDK